MAKTPFGSGNIVSRSAASSAVKKENKAIANRPQKWTPREAQRAHRRGNTSQVKRIKAAI